MDITLVLETVFRLLVVVFVAVFIPCIRNMGKTEQLVKAMKVTEEVAKIATTVVKAANEMEITGELIKIQKTKAEYALEEAKKSLERKGIVFDEQELMKYIKAAVTELRTSITNTSAEKQ